MRVRVRAIAVDNNWLGEFVLSPIPAAPKGVTKMIVCFEIDANGIFNVSAMEKSTGVSFKITITNYKAPVSTKVIPRIVEDVEKYEVEDDEQGKKIRRTRRKRICTLLMHSFRLMTWHASWFSNGPLWV
jgi:heat shock protein 1/8